jgi:3-hydroxybutyryl-CoA dehydratase
MDFASLGLGYRLVMSLTLTNDAIISGAKFLNDRNPIHNDVTVAAASRFGGLIACGPHVSGLHACMLPSFFTEVGANVLGTYFTVRYAAPVHANVPHELHWEISKLEPHRSGGTLIDWAGAVTSQATHRTCIEATGQVLAS